MANNLISETIEIIKETDTFSFFDNPAIGPQSDAVRSFWAIRPLNVANLDGRVEAVFYNCVEDTETLKREFDSFGHMVSELGLDTDAATRIATYWEGLNDSEAVSYDNKKRVSLIGRLESLTTESVEELAEKKANYKTATGFHKASFAAHARREKEAALKRAQHKAAKIHHATKASTAQTSIGRAWHKTMASFHSARAKAHAGVQAHHTDMMRHHAASAGLRMKRVHSGPTMAQGATKAGRAAMKQAAKPKAKPAPPKMAKPTRSEPVSSKPPARPSRSQHAAAVAAAKPVAKKAEPAAAPKSASSGSPQRPEQPARKKKVAEPLKKNRSPIY